MPKLNEAVYEQVVGFMEGVPEHAVLLQLKEGLLYGTAICHFNSVRAGWYRDPYTGDRLDRNVAEMLCLIHSEISEAMEGYRKDKMDDHLPDREMVEVELADAMIRIFDLAGFLGVDLAGAVIEKLAYNKERSDHKLTNRAEKGGKKF
jgi:NTP pyrophosphatase (non-canonical NTP hydrolase)